MPKSIPPRCVMCDKPLTQRYMLVNYDNSVDEWLSPYDGGADRGFQAVGIDCFKRLLRLGLARKSWGRLTSFSKGEVPHAS